MKNSTKTIAKIYKLLGDALVTPKQAIELKPLLLQLQKEATHEGYIKAHWEANQ